MRAGVITPKQEPYKKGSLILPSLTSSFEAPDAPTVTEEAARTAVRRLPPTPPPTWLGLFGFRAFGASGLWVIGKSGAGLEGFKPPSLGASLAALLLSAGARGPASSAESSTTESPGQSLAFGRFGVRQGVT